MRLRVPFLIRLMGVLLIVAGVITAGVVYVVQAAQPMPMCILYNKWDNAKGRYDLRQVDSRSGQLSPARRDFETTLTSYLSNIAYASNGQAYMDLFLTNYGGFDLLRAGVPNSEKLREVDSQYEMSGGWSPDGQAYSYLFNSIELDASNIAITDAAGTRKRIYSLDSFKREELWSWEWFFAGWSADSRYMTAMTYGPSLEGWPGVVHYFFDTQRSQFVATPVTVFGKEWYGLTSSLTWSSQGNRFAYIDLAANQFYLVIATPEGGEEQRFALRGQDERGAELPLVWSPDGRYVTVYRVTEADKSPIQYATYNIFGIDGSADTGIKGQWLYPNSYGSGLDEFPPLDSWWSVDGSTWYFRQDIQRQASTNGIAQPESYVMGYQVETNTYQMLAEHVVDAPMLLDDGNWFAVSVWEADKLNVELYAIDGKQRHKIVMGAVLNPKLRLTPSPDHDAVAVVWNRLTAAGHQIAALTWAQADGADLHTIDRAFDAINDIYWLNDGQALLYVARRGTKFFMEIVNVATGESVSRLDELPLDAFAMVRTWERGRVFPSPSGQQLVLKVGAWRGQHLYLITLPNKHLQLLQPDQIAVGDVVWSPDGTMLTFAEYGLNGLNDTLWIISADGLTLHRTDLQQQYLRPSYFTRLAGWGWCQ